MQSLWSGTLSFGLVSIPCRMGPIVKSHRIPFRQMHRADGGYVQHRMKCELDDKLLDPEEIGRAYELAGGKLVEITDDELANMPLPTARTIEVSGFLDAASVDFMQLDTPYVLAPGQGGDKPYALMREALRRAGKAAVGKVAMSGKERLLLVRAHGDVLIAQTLHWPDEMKSPTDAAPPAKVTVSPEELAAALALIDELGEADLEDQEDRYTTAVEQLVGAKMEGAAIAKTAAAHAGPVVDLMEALRASLEEAKKKRSEQPPAPSGKDGSTTARKRPGTKAPVKRAAKKAPAKKSAAKKKPGGTKHSA